MNELFVPFSAEEARKKMGRPLLYTPDELLDQFELYLKDRKKRKIVIEETETGQTGETEYDKAKKRRKHHPLSVRDFCVFLNASYEWWKKLPEDFLPVKNVIANNIYVYQLKGAELGEFNANIVARELGLADKKDVSATVQEIPKEFTKEQAKDFIANLNK